MPCIKCEQNKWKIGTGKCVYTTLQYRGRHESV